MTAVPWYVFSAFGFYPVPGTDKYWVGSPCVDSAEIDLGEGKTLKITANNQDEKNIYVSSAELNGKPISNFIISHSDIETGGELTFTMSKNTK